MAVRLHHLISTKSIPGVLSRFPIKTPAYEVNEDTILQTNHHKVSLICGERRFMLPSLVLRWVLHAGTFSSQTERSRWQEESICTYRTAKYSTTKSS